MENIELGWNEFWAELFRVKHRRSIPGIEHNDKMIVDFCMESLGLKKGNEILDIACGAGEHCIEFAKAGLVLNIKDFEGLKQDTELLNLWASLKGQSGFLREIHKEIENSVVDLVRRLENELNIYKENPD